MLHSDLFPEFPCDSELISRGSIIDRKDLSSLVLRLRYGAHLRVRLSMGMGCLSGNEIGPEGVMLRDNSLSYPSLTAHGEPPWIFLTLVPIKLAQQVFACASGIMRISGRSEESSLALLTARSVAGDAPPCGFGLAPAQSLSLHLRRSIGDDFRNAFVIGYLSGNADTLPSVGRFRVAEFRAVTSPD